MSRQNNSFLHIGFENYVYLGALIAVLNENNETLLITDSGIKKSDLTANTLLNRINFLEEK